jgi:putative heme iron utilization protein
MEDLTLFPFDVRDVLFISFFNDAGDNVLLMLVFVKRDDDGNLGLARLVISRSLFVYLFIFGSLYAVDYEHE